MEKPATASQLLRPRLVDVARLAGVSTATASRALSNPDLVAVSTRKAVQAAAENFGYKVNLVARSLRKQCSQAILVLIPALDNQFYPEIFHGIEAGAHRRGYAIVLGFTSRDHWREQTYLEILNSRRADGLIIVDPQVRKQVESGARGPVPAAGRPAGPVPGPGPPCRGTAAGPGAAGREAVPTAGGPGQLPRERGEPGPGGG